MKNVKLNLVALLAILVFFTACKKEELGLDNNFENTELVEEAGVEDDELDSTEFDDDSDDDNTASDDESGIDDEASDQTDDSDFGGDIQGEGTLTSYSINGDNITKIEDFDVPQDMIPFQQDREKHQAMWSYFTRLIPAKYRTKIVEFEVIHGRGESGGYVAPVVEGDLSRWRMGLAIDFVDDLNKIDVNEEFAYIVIHELGHVLTLNNEQLAAGEEGNCGTFHTGEGCSFNTSYINALYELGWKDIYDEFQQIQAEEGTLDFYFKYKDRFVTEYAASNPGEDMAEVFAVFVTQDDKPVSSSIADQKVRLMYDYPELVELRNAIRKDPVLRTMQPGSWKRIGCKHKHKKQKHQHAFHTH